MMTKIAFCLCILSVCAFADPPQRFAFDDGGTIAAAPAPEAEKPSEAKFAIDHGTDLPAPKVEEKTARAAPDPNAPSAVEEPFVPNPLKVRLRPEERAVIRELNQARSAKGLILLAPAQSLMDGARSHSVDMRNRNYFAHKPMHLLPGNGNKAENIAAGNSSPAATMQQWWTSKTGHKENMMSQNYAYIGVGYAPGGHNPKIQGYWTQNFSSKP